ncbi:NAD(P)-dependent oxidoreductase [Sulfurimonas sediminis]|uniref:dTDP-4-dehydrorhamnose reductase n=1 Tax=Sulfurimonas sediminis TaxID=2590020 RepID=A0A7M1AYZ6_9BACT|nr:NAD-dependent epimerase/dehydratase family protein [Sulfurimonas sediminis]QOP42671.1 NAD(P)-dependent oxidoreductase [Sulfurimonas sediminis]
MIIGNGQLAQAFKELDKRDDVIIFASGVANSNCTDKSEFEKEKDLLIKTLINNKKKKFVYFSSCALSAKEYQLNDYYIHKQNMEKIIKEHSASYYIFRIPQLFADIKRHSTLINYLFYAIKEEKEIKIYKDAFRYVIALDDVHTIVIQLIEHHKGGTTLDIANSYRYSIAEIVEIIEQLTNKKANSTLINKKDAYTLDLIDLYNTISQYNIDGIKFGKSYLYDKLLSKLSL